ncbi:MAG TPA: DUF488 domain-containing protein [Gemmatimonadaceae bacterium]|nr:DUF488 domain-containing protein [Gemmatimonadaceae bacterium]
MPPTLYTLGYEKRSILEFTDLLLQAGIGVLVDVRESAWSHKPGFSKKALDAALRTVGIEYVHASFAGNPRALRQTAPDHAACLDAYRSYVHQNASILERLEELVASYQAMGARVCLTCYERHADDCHRGILAECWGTRGARRVEHLAVEGCLRLVPAQMRAGILERRTRASPRPTYTTPPGTPSSLHPQGD